MTDNIKLKRGRPRMTIEQLRTKQKVFERELEELGKRECSLRTANQLRRIDYLMSYTRRIERRIKTGKWS